MRALSATPTWVMNLQLFLNNPSTDKWQRPRVKKSKLSAEQKYDKSRNLKNPLSLCGTNLSFGQIRNPSSVQQRANAANICLCYHKCISMWLPRGYLRQKGATTNNWRDNAELWERTSLSLWGSILWSTSLYLLFCSDMIRLLKIEHYISQWRFRKCKWCISVNERSLKCWQMQMGLAFCTCLLPLTDEN